MTAVSEPLVVDTAVGVVANGSDDVSLECQLACVELLREIVDDGHIVLDALELIFTEYRQQLSLSGQSGPGDEFMRWVFTHRFNPDRCTLIPLTPRNQERDDFEEFRLTSDLELFDRADRKFAAVAKEYPAPLVVAVDRGWSRHRDALRAAGVVLHFLCPDDIAT